jgi:nudix-type nucleoside diphosphatase (YffH/AdpP family)
MATITRQTLVYDNWYRFYRLELTMADGALAERHLLDNGSAVAVLPYDLERRCVLLISQPRAAVIAAGEPPLLETIAGMLESAAPDDQVRQEALEEAGLRLGALVPVASVWSMPAVSTERVHLYLAEYRAGDRIGPGGGAEGEHEHIQTHEISFDRLREMVAEGELRDAHSLVLAQALLMRLAG